MFLLTCVYRLVFTVTNRLREEVVKINKAAGNAKLHWYRNHEHDPGRSEIKYQYLSRQETLWRQLNMSTWDSLWTRDWILQYNWPEQGHSLIYFKLRHYTDLSKFTLIQEKNCSDSRNFILIKFCHIFIL